MRWSADLPRCARVLAAVHSGWTRGPYGGYFVRTKSMEGSIRSCESAKPRRCGWPSSQNVDLERQVVAQLMRQSSRAAVGG